MAVETLEGPILREGGRYSVEDPLESLKHERESEPNLPEIVLRQSEACSLPFLDPNSATGQALAFFEGELGLDPQSSRNAVHLCIAGGKRFDAAAFSRRKYDEAMQYVDGALSTTIVDYSSGSESLNAIKTEIDLAGSDDGSKDNLVAKYGKLVYLKSLGIKVDDIKRFVQRADFEAELQELYDTKMPQNILDLAKEVAFSEETEFGMGGAFPVVDVRVDSWAAGSETKGRVCLNQGNMLRWLRSRVNIQYEQDSSAAMNNFEELYKKTDNASFTFGDMLLNDRRFFVDDEGGYNEGLLEASLFTIWTPDLLSTLSKTMKDADQTGTKGWSDAITKSRIIVDNKLTTKYGKATTLGHLLASSVDFDPDNPERNLGAAFAKGASVFYNLGDYPMLERILGRDSSFLTRGGIDRAITQVQEKDGRNAQGQTLKAYLGEQYADYQKAFGIDEHGEMRGDGRVKDEQAFIQFINFFNKTDALAKAIVMQAVQNCVAADIVSKQGARGVVKDKHTLDYLKMLWETSFRPLGALYHSNLKVRSNFPGSVLEYTDIYLEGLVDKNRPNTSSMFGAINSVATTLAAGLTVTLPNGRKVNFLEAMLLEVDASALIDADLSLPQIDCMIARLEELIACAGEDERDALHRKRSLLEGMRSDVSGGACVGRRSLLAQIAQKEKRALESSDVHVVAEQKRQIFMLLSHLETLDYMKDDAVKGAVGGISVSDSASRDWGNSQKYGHELLSYLKDEVFGLEKGIEYGTGDRFRVDTDGIKKKLEGLTIALNYAWDGCDFRTTVRKPTFVVDENGKKHMVFCTATQAEANFPQEVLDEFKMRNGQIDFEAIQKSKGKGKLMEILARRILARQLKYFMMNHDMDPQLLYNILEALHVSGGPEFLRRGAGVSKVRRAAGIRYSSLFLREAVIKQLSHKMKKDKNPWEQMLAHIFA